MSYRHRNPLLRFALLSLIFALSACVSGPSKSEIPPTQLIQTDDLAQVRDTAVSLAQKLGTEQVLVIFDIDNTLLAMEQDLGSDQWYDWQDRLKKKNPCDPRAVDHIFAAQGALYASSAMRPTQPDGPAIVKSIQEQGLKVFALTSRGADYRLQTFRELRRAGISFYSSAIGPAGGFPNTFTPEGGSRPARYEDGVFLTAGQDKGIMLKALLAKTGTPSPAVVVMADDKPKNLDQMLAAFGGTGTSIQAFHYTREDAVVAQFDEDAAAEQWKSLKPALLQLQSVFGPDNFELPPDAANDACVDGTLRPPPGVAGHQLDSSPQ